MSAEIIDRTDDRAGPGPIEHALRIWRASKPGQDTPVQTYPGSAKIISLPNERRLTFVTFADIEDHPRQRWLVQNFLGVGEISAIYGMPGTAKSALAGDLGAHVAAGFPWFSRQVSQGAVLYIAAERAALVNRRMAAWRLHYGINDIPLGIVAKSIDLRSDRKDADSVIECCDRLQKTFGHDPRLVIIDTLSRASPVATKMRPVTWATWLRIWRTFRKAQAPMCW